MKRWDREFPRNADQWLWGRRSQRFKDDGHIVNVAGSGWFSSDRTIRQYAREIWNTPFCPIP